MSERGRATPYGAGGGGGRRRSGGGAGRGRRRAGSGGRGGDGGQTRTVPPLDDHGEPRTGRRELAERTTQADTGVSSVRSTQLETERSQIGSGRTTQGDTGRSQTVGGVGGRTTQVDTGSSYTPGASVRSTQLEIERSQIGGGVGSRTTQAFTGVSQPAPSSYVRTTPTDPLSSKTGPSPQPRSGVDSGGSEIVGGARIRTTPAFTGTSQIGGGDNVRGFQADSGGSQLGRTYIKTTLSGPSQSLITAEVSSSQVSKPPQTEKSTSDPKDELTGSRDVSGATPQPSASVQISRTRADQPGGFQASFGLGSQPTQTGLRSTLISFEDSSSSTQPGPPVTTRADVITSRIDAKTTVGDVSQRGGSSVDLIRAESGSTAASSLRDKSTSKSDPKDLLTGVIDNLSKSDPASTKPGVGVGISKPSPGSVLTGAKSDPIGVLSGSSSIPPKPDRASSQTGVSTSKTGPERVPTDVSILASKSDPEKAQPDSSIDRSTAKPDPKGVPTSSSVGTPKSIPSTPTQGLPITTKSDPKSDPTEAKLPKSDPKSVPITTTLPSTQDLPKSDPKSIATESKPSKFDPKRFPITAAILSTQVSPTTSKSDSKTVPTTSKSESVPTTSKSESVPTTSKSETVPTTSKSETVPTTSKSDPKTVPTSSKSKTVPTTSKSVPKAVPSTSKSDIKAVPTTSASLVSPNDDNETDESYSEATEGGMEGAKARLIAGGGGGGGGGGGVGSAGSSTDHRDDSQIPSETMPLLGGGGDGLGLGWGVRLAYGLGHVFNDVCAAMWFSYTLLFLQVVLGMAPVLAGTMLLIGQVTDALATPVVGVLADKKGSRKLWHLIGTGLVLISFPMIFSPCPGCSTGNTTLMALYYAAVIAVFQIGWAVVQISHLAIIPDLTENQKQRAGLTAIRYTASVCSSVAVYVITWSVFHVTRNTMLDSIGSEDAYKFRNIVLITTGLGLAASIYFHLGLKSRHLKPKGPQRTADDSQKLRSIASYFKSPTLFQVSFLHVASRLFLTISLVYMPLYLNETYGEDSEILALVPLVSYIASFAASLGIKYINNSWGSKTSYFLGAVVSIFGCVWIRCGTGVNHAIGNVYGASVLLGGGSSITMVTSLCITAELIGTHTHNGAFVYSIVTFADKLFNGIAVMVIEDLKCPSQELCPHYYRDILAYVCGGSAILGVLVLITMLFLTGTSKIISEPTEIDIESKNQEATVALTQEVT